MGRYDNIKVWNGSSWVKPSEVSVWNGSQWVSLGDDNSSNTNGMYVWNGSEWVRKTLNKTTTYGDKWVYGPISSSTAVRIFNNAYEGVGAQLWAGFEGWVRIDFAQFDNPTWETNGTAFSDQFPVAYMVFNVNAQLHESESFIIDSIGYYYTETSISTMFAQSQYGILDAMNSNYNG